jgi:hypothetical protein
MRGALAGLGMALFMEGDGYNPEATLEQREKALRKYRVVDEYAQGSRKYQVYRSGERAPDGSYAYRKRIMDETGATLDIQKMTAEDLARYVPRFGGEMKGDALERVFDGVRRVARPRSDHAIDQAGIMTAQILAAKRGRSPLQDLAYSVAPGIAGAGMGPLASLALAGQIEGANRQAEARASMMDARGVGPAPGVALEALPNAIANPIVRALVALQTGTLRVEVVNTPKQGAPRNTQGP